ncbi:hypothetical protein ANN_12209 [Periplaneta americana]|uniref:Laccase n=1 Tax=Periplaneta americana TaxID=6978 RepID=A0ABQ8TGK5_PERAM|nr:hypothetical protein ANN_12209 [Periplaneta americana]
MVSTLAVAVNCIFLSVTLYKCSAYISEAVNLEQYLQPDVIKDRHYFSNTSCYRPCDESAAPKICYYKWVLKDFKTMGPACRNCPTNATDCFRYHCITADGYERGLITVNQQLPGPSVQVCYGDRIVIDVSNMLQGQTSSLHWHGLYQYGSPHMDGVPMITQCPIQGMTDFRYDFKAGNYGTMYWHSHDGFQKQDGIQGAFVVRTSKTLDPNGHLYDYDLASHVIFISDWMHSSATEHFPGLKTHQIFQRPQSILLNGRGRYEVTGNATTFPSAVFRVTPGKKYRFRLVGGMCTSCAYQFRVQQHELLVIAVDGNPTEPVLVDSIHMYGGERYDFVLEAVEEVKSYCIHVKTVGNCKFMGLYGMGVLRYIGEKSTTVLDPGYEGFHSGKVMNIYNGTCFNSDEGVCLDQLVSLLPVSKRLTALEPDVTVTLSFGFHVFTLEELFQPRLHQRYFEPRPNHLLTSLVNNISYVAPNAPLLTQREDIKSSLICPANHDGTSRCPQGSGGFCECTHLIRIPLGAVTQFVLVDRGFGGINHPFHLHGYSFNVIAMGNFENGQNKTDIIEDISRGKLKISQSPILKDTIAVPAQGYAVLRIYTDNPGYWFFHCHVLYHADTGMGVVLQVGDQTEMPRAPEGFPRCGDFTPPVYKTRHYWTP